MQEMTYQFNPIITGLFWAGVVPGSGVSTSTL